MALWRVEPPLRMSRRITGLRPNGDLHGDEAARIEVFGCEPGELQLTLLGKEGRPDEDPTGRRDPRRAHDSAERGLEAVAVPTPKDADGSGRCVYVLETDGLIGSTRIDFVSERLGSRRPLRRPAR